MRGTSSSPLTGGLLASPLASDPSRVGTPPAEKSVYGGVQTFAGSTGSQLELPSDDDEHALLRVASQVKPGTHPASLVHATSMTLQAFSPLGWQLQLSELDWEEPEPDEPGVEPPADPLQLHSCRSSQVKPAPQSAAVVQGSVQRDIHS